MGPVRSLTTSFTSVFNSYTIGVIVYFLITVLKFSNTLNMLINLVVNKLKINNQEFDFKLPVKLNQPQLTSILQFFLGKNEPELIEATLDNQVIQITNYLEYINTNLKANYTSEILAKYIVTNTQDLEQKLAILKITKTSQNSSITIESKFKQLTANLTAEQIASFHKFADIMVKIKKTEKEIDNYQNQKTTKEDLNTKLKNAENTKNTLEQKLSAVQSLLDQKTKIESELTKASQNNSQTDINAIKQRRVEELNTKLGNGFKQASAKNTYIETQEPPKKKYIWLAVLAIAQLGLSVLYYLFTQNIYFFAVGAGTSCLIAIVYFLSRKSNSKTNTKVEQTPEDLDRQQSDVQILPTEAEDKNILKTAYTSALVAEKNNLEASITKSLENKTYQQVKTELDNTVNLIATIKQQQEDSNNNSLDIDSYYKKRRELDILKIEKENLDFSAKIPAKPDDEYIQLLINSNSQEIVNTQESPEVNLPIILIGKEPSFDEIIEKYNNIRQVIVLYENF